eukprot:tig00020816_g14107.t1
MAEKERPPGPQKSMKRFGAKSFLLQKGASRQNKAIEAFFSRSVARNVVERIINSPVDLLPRGGDTEELVGCASFVDLSGFTRICDEYSAKGDAGIEYLWTLINGFFERQLAIITEFGGVPISFSGDAVLSLWIGEGRPAPGSREEEEALRRCCAAAARCGLEMQRAFASDRGGGARQPERRGSNAVDLGSSAAAAAAAAAAQDMAGHHMRRTGSTVAPPAPPAPASKAAGALSLKITLASGRFTAFHLGGKKERRAGAGGEEEEGEEEETLLNIEGRFLYFVSGAPLVELGVLDKYVRAGQVLAAASAWRHLREAAFACTPLPIAGPAGAVEGPASPEAAPLPSSVPTSEQATPRKSAPASAGAPQSPSSPGSGFAYVVTGWAPALPAVPPVPALGPLQLEGRLCPPFLALYAPSFVRRRVADMLPKMDYEEAAPPSTPLAAPASGGIAAALAAAAAAGAGAGASRGRRTARGRAGRPRAPPRRTGP